LSTASACSRRLPGFALARERERGRQRGCDFPRRIRSTQTSWPGQARP
jgi:hypothetical protein